MALQIVGGALTWSGEHWICMLREPGSDDTAVVSHYHLRVSPAGPGNVAVIHVPGTDGAHVVATDNDDAATFARERFILRAFGLLPRRPAGAAGDLRTHR